VRTGKKHSAEKVPDHRAPLPAIGAIHQNTGNPARVDTLLSLTSSRTTSILILPKHFVRVASAVAERTASMAFFCQKAKKKEASSSQTRTRAPAADDR